MRANIIDQKKKDQKIKSIDQSDHCIGNQSLLLFFRTILFFSLILSSTNSLSYTYFNWLGLVEHQPVSREFQQVPPGST